jgi:hypothetical protein
VTRKIVKNSSKILSHHHGNGNVLNQSSMDIGPFLKSFNSFHAMAVNKRPTFGVIFLGEHFSLKMGPIAPSLATIQPFSIAHAFLLG